MRRSPTYEFSFLELMDLRMKDLSVIGYFSHDSINFSNSARKTVSTDKFVGLALHLAEFAKFFNDDRNFAIKLEIV